MARDRVGVIQHKAVWLGLALAFLLGVAFCTPAVAQQIRVRAVLFWSQTCPHCHVVLEQTLPPLQAQYGHRLEVQTIEISDPAHYELWLRAIEAFHVPRERQGVPMLFIGDAVLVGSWEIPQLLPGLIEKYLASGGVDYPAIPGLKESLAPAPTSTPQPNPTPRPTPTLKACHICDEEDAAPAPSSTPEDVPLSPSPTPEAVVHFWLFYDSHCDDCQILLNEILPPILAKYPEGQVIVHEQDLQQGGSDLMRALEVQHGLGYGTVPEIFIGDQSLMGNPDIEARLESLIDTYLAQGGVALPEVPTPVAATAGPTTLEDPPAIHLAYFYQTGCLECDRVHLDLNYLQHRYPQLVVHTFDVREEAALAEWLGERAGVPTEKRLVAPAVFVGAEGLVDEALGPRSLEELVVRHVDTGAEPAWEGWEAHESEARETIVGRFRSFGLLTVLAAGLVDGLNPCAFATIVFFVSYLAFTGRKGREILAVGAAFTAGVFLTYLGVGFGVMRAIAALPFMAAAGRWIYGLSAVLCLVLAGGSFYDYLQARRGRPEEMRLRLPLRLRRQVNRLIREGAGARALVPAAFVSGALVSLVELACTGQVYLPTILFVLGVPEMQARATGYLLLYNGMFIFPLVVVFTAAYLGTTSEQLGMLVNRHTQTVKLATAILFLALAAWLIGAMRFYHIL
ncbi:MAG: hypothetical protein ACUVXG_05185 [Anaerolineae bacterium]